MINTSHQSLITRITENAIQSSQQNKQINEQRLADNIQAKKIEDKRVEDKSRVDLQTPNVPAFAEAERSLFYRQPESEEIFERYTAKGLSGNLASNVGTNIDIKV